MKLRKNGHLSCNEYYGVVFSKYCPSFFEKFEVEKNNKKPFWIKMPQIKRKYKSVSSVSQELLRKEKNNEEKEEGNKNGENQENNNQNDENRGSSHDSDGDGGVFDNNGDENSPDENENRIHKKSSEQRHSVVSAFDFEEAENEHSEVGSDEYEEDFGNQVNPDIQALSDDLEEIVNENLEMNISNFIPPQAYESDEQEIDDDVYFDSNYNKSSLISANNQIDLSRDSDWLIEGISFPFFLG